MSFKEKVLYKVSVVSAGNILNAVMGFIFLTAAAKYLTLSDFGKYALLTSSITLIARIMDFGTNSIFVSQHGKDNERNALFLFLKIVLFCVALPVALLFLSYFKLDTLSLLTIFILGLIGYGINFTLYAYYQKVQRYTEVVLLNTIPSVIKVIYAVAVFTGYLKLNLDNTFAIFAYSIFGSLIVYFLKPIKIFSFSADKEVVSMSDIWKLLKESVSPGISQLIYESWSTVNNALTKLYNTFSDVGVFSMANKISNIFYLISFSVFTVLLPKNAERKSKKHSYNFYETGMLAVGVLVLSLVAIVAARIFLTKMFGSKFESSLEFLSLLIFANAITAVQNFVENYFYVENETQYLVRINLTKLILLILFAVIAVPVYGLTSLATANLVSAIVGIVMTYVYINRLEKLKV